MVASCNGDIVYTQSQSIAKQGWALNDTLVFSPVLEVSESPHDLVVWVRHTKEYAYSNIWLKVISDPVLIGGEESEAMIEVPLADKSGKWLGTCSQSMCTQKFVIRENFNVENNGAFKVAVLQYMREQILSDVKEVGLELVLHEEATAASTPS